MFYEQTSSEKINKFYIHLKAHFTSRETQACVN